MTRVVVGQRLDFDVVDYPEENKCLFRYVRKARDFVDIADVSHLILPDARRQGVPELIIFGRNI